MPGVGSPTLVAGLIRLGTVAPFAQAAELLAHFTRVQLSTSTVRRQTEQAGAVWEQLQAAAVALLEEPGNRAAAVPAAATQLLSVDGAMVPLVGGQWAEVKTLALGSVVAGCGSEPPETTDLSYFSRMADAASFTRLATVEVVRRGTAGAETVCAVNDGAAWIQGFIDHHRADAVRILDFAHALEHVSAALAACFGPGSVSADAWLHWLRHKLRHGEPVTVLEALCRLPVEQASEPEAAAQARDSAVQYLASRWQQIQYAAFAQAGYPIGSGCVESANKLLVEARLKGSGMHWAPQQVNPMLALRTVLCNQRWDTGLPAILRGRRCRSDQARTHRPATAAAARASIPLLPATGAGAPPAATASDPTPPDPDRPRTTRRAPRIVGGKPTSEHPWKKHRLLHRQQTSPDPKL